MDLAERITDRSPRGIAAAIAALVRAGELAPGDRLPSVRELGPALGVSPATVGSAYRTLGAVGMVRGRGRAGTEVADLAAGAAPPLPPSYRALAGGDRATWLDLARGTPDPHLLPSIAHALHEVADGAAAQEHPSPLVRDARASGWNYADPPLLAELERAVAPTWPYRPEAITVMDGALDAVVRLLEQSVAFGDAVAVEDPGFPPFFDVVERLGARRLPLTVDRHGATPDSLAAALDAGARVVVLQPRAHNPTGVSMTATRARELASLVRRHTTEHAGTEREAAPVLRRRRVLVIEDDHTGAVASSRDVTLGVWAPDHVVRVRSYSKSHGPDLRVAVVGGPYGEIGELVSRRMLGPGWTSRMLQRTLVALLADPAAHARVERARLTYRRRQEELVAALAAQGLEVSAGDGLNLWLPVACEADALDRLAAVGIRAVGGSAFHRAPREGDHLRLTVAGIADDPEEIAALARALVVAAG